VTYDEGHMTYFLLPYALRFSETVSKFWVRLEAYAVFFGFEDTNEYEDLVE